MTDFTKEQLAVLEMARARFRRCTDVDWRYRSVRKTHSIKEGPEAALGDLAPSI